MTRNEITTAKALLDNLDNVNKAIAAIGKPGGTIVVSLAQSGAGLTIATADAITFLTGLQAIITGQLQAVGVTL